MCERFGLWCSSVYDKEEDVGFLTSGFAIIFTTNVLITHTTASTMVPYLGERYEKGLGLG